MFSRIAKLLSFTRVVKNEANVTDVKFDQGGGDNITAEHFAPPGDDSFPLPGDYVLGVDVPRSGAKVAAGYVDPVNTPKALEGDKRIYARDPADGTPVNGVWLKNDGTVLIDNDNCSGIFNPDGSILITNANGSILLRVDGSTVTTTPASTFDCKADGSIKGDNGNGSFELQTGGDFVVNGVVIDTAGNVTTAATVTAVTSVVTTSLQAVSSLTVSGKEMKGHIHSQGNDSNGDSQVNTNGPV